MPIGPPITLFTKESDEFEAKDEEVTTNKPVFEKCNLGQVFVDPKWRHPNQLWKAKWVVYRDYLNYDDLQQLRLNPDYDIPPDDVLRAIFLGDEEQTKPIDSVEESLQANTSVHHAAPEDQDFSEDPLQKPMQVLECGFPPRFAWCCSRRLSSAAVPTCCPRNRFCRRTIGTSRTPGMGWAWAASRARINASSRDA